MNLGAFTYGVKMTNCRQIEKHDSIDEGESECATRVGRPANSK